jgi:hypothetical protein
MIGYIWLHKARPIAGGPELARGVWIKTPPVAVFQDRNWAIRYGLGTVVEWCFDLREGGYTLWTCEWRPAEGLRLGGVPNWAAPYGETQYITEQGVAVEALPHRASLAGEVRLIEAMGIEETKALLRKEALNAAQDNIDRAQRLGR